MVCLKNLVEKIKLLFRSNVDIAIDDQTSHDDWKRMPNQMLCNFVDDGVHYIHTDNLDLAYELLVDLMLQMLVIVIEHVVNLEFYQKIHSLENIQVM